MSASTAVVEEKPGQTGRQPDEAEQHCSAFARVLRKGKGQFPIAASALSLLAVMLFSLGLGKYPIAPKEILQFLCQKYFGAAFFSADHMRLLNSILVEIRLPRILAAALIGSGRAGQASTIWARSDGV